MTDQAIIHRFESGAFPASDFHHADHVRLAFAYLKIYPVLSALEKFHSIPQTLLFFHYGVKTLYEIENFFL